MIRTLWYNEVLVIYRIPSVCRDKRLIRDTAKSKYWSLSQKDPTTYVFDLDRIGTHIATSHWIKWFPSNLCDTMKPLDDS